MAITNTSTGETPDLTTIVEKLADLRARLTETQVPMDQVGISHVRDKGKMTIHERVELLLDEGSFAETDALARHYSKDFGLNTKHSVTDGAITGYGAIDDRQVCVFPQDGTIFGGALDETYGGKVVKITDPASKASIPIIGINEDVGARIQGGVVSLGPYFQIFFRNTQASSTIPQTSLIMRAYTDGHVYSPTPTNFIVMVDDVSKMFITDLDATKTVTDEEAIQEGLGSTSIHMSTSGTLHYTAADDEDVLTFVQELVSYLSSNDRVEAPRMEAEPFEGTTTDNIIESDLEFDTLIPGSSNQLHGIKDVIVRLVDDEDPLETQKNYVQNVAIGSDRVESRSAGLVANQPVQFVGCLDIKTSEKVARLVRTCGAFNTPIIMLVNVPGFPPGTNQGFGGVIRRGAKLLYTYAEVTAPKITVITRKAYDGTYCAMGSKDMGADINLAWPIAQIMVMGTSDVVGLIYHKKPRVTTAEGKDVAVLQKEYKAEYEATLVSPYMVARCGFIDAVTPPSETRGRIIESLRLLNRKVVNVPVRKYRSVPL